MSLVVFDIERLDGKIVKELGDFKDGIVLVYSFLQPNEYKPTFQAKWNTKNLHGTNWNNGKLEYTSCHQSFTNIIHLQQNTLQKGKRSVISARITCVRMWRS